MSLTPFGQIKFLGDVDAMLDEMGPAVFRHELVDEGVAFEGTIRRLGTPRGRTLVLAEDVIGLLDAQIEAGGSLEDVRRWLTNRALEANDPAA